MPWLRALAHAASLLALATVGLLLGRFARHPDVSGAVFVLVVIVAVAALLRYLYRPGGVADLRRPPEAAEPAAATTPVPVTASQEVAAPEPAPEVAAAPAAQPPVEATPAPAEEEEEEEEEAAEAAPPPAAPATPRLRARPAAALLAGLVIVLVVVGIVAWPSSHGGGSHPVARNPAPPTSAPAAPPTSSPRSSAPRAPRRPAARPHPRPHPRPGHRVLSARGLGSGTLQLGDHGPKVRLLQRLLGVTPLSGLYGVKTALAVQKFQLRHKLPGSGVVAKLTHAALKKRFP
jgi:hypothetical protein